jgi:hypothetical protein
MEKAVLLGGKIGAAWMLWVRIKLTRAAAIVTKMMQVQ